MVLTVFLANRFLIYNTLKPFKKHFLTKSNISEEVKDYVQQSHTRERAVPQWGMDQLSPTEDMDAVKFNINVLENVFNLKSQSVISV